MYIDSSEVPLPSALEEDRAHEPRPPLWASYIVKVARGGSHNSGLVSPSCPCGVGVGVEFNKRYSK